MKPLLTFSVPFPPCELCPTGQCQHNKGRTITVFPFEDPTLPLFKDDRTPTGNAPALYFGVHGQEGLNPPQVRVNGGFILTLNEARAIRHALNELEKMQARIAHEGELKLNI